MWVHTVYNPKLKSICCNEKTAVEQWHSQNAEKVMSIKGGLLDQAVILFNCVPFAFS